MNFDIIYNQIGADAKYKIWHTTGKNMIIFIEKGFGSIVLGEKNYPLETGVLCFIGASKYHYTIPDNPSDYIRSKVFIDDSDLNKILAFFPKKYSGMFTNKSVVYAKVDNTEYVNELFSKINKSKNKDCAVALTCSCYMELLTIIIQNITENYMVQDSFMSKVIEYINKNIKENITIDSICKEIHMSKYYFCHKFKKSAGITVMEYVLKTRIMLAKSLLESGNKSITEISEECGFSSVSYFCRTFKNNTGLSPLKYKNKFS